MKVAEAGPDVVVLDVSMPDLDGIEVCRHLRADGNDVPVLMLSALDEVADRVAGLQAGGDDSLEAQADTRRLRQATTRPAEAPTADAAHCPQ
ncbi:response regulator [Streptomyces tubercidicus]